MISIESELLLNEFFDVMQEFVFLRGAEGNSLAVSSGASGAANAVNVGFGFIREVEVYDEGDVFDIDPTCGHIGSHENG